MMNISNDKKAAYKKGYDVAFEIIESRGYAHASELLNQRLQCLDSVCPYWTQGYMMGLITYRVRA